MNRKAIQINSVSREQVERYDLTKNDSHGPCVETFRLDLANKELSSSWNKHAIEIFGEAFISRDEYASNIDEVERTFKTHLIQLQAQYRKSLAEEATQDELDLEKELARTARRRGVRDNHSIFRL